MSRPNILFLFTDQQRFDTIGALGNAVIQTPHLDRLVREGTAFTSAYSPSPECVPARCCLITGQYVNRHGCASNAQDMPLDAKTFMSRLTDAGYRTHGVGKCHFTPDAEAMRGFQTRDMSEEVPHAGECSDYADRVDSKGYDYVMEPLGIRGEMYYVPQPSQLPAEAHHTQWVADKCLDFIDDANAGEDPWFCYGGFIHPHPPFCPPNPWHKLYRGPDMPPPHLPSNYEELLCFVNRFQNRYKYRDQGFDNNLYRCMRAYYYACISFIDYQVGRLIEKLESLGQLDNTLILYSSDHGELLGDFHSYGKRSFHDAASRIPLLARLPSSFAAGATCDIPTSLVDIGPTCCAAAGLDADKDVDGVDLCALAKGDISRDAVFMQYHREGDCLASTITSDFKYTWSAPDQREYLFRREDSPETTDLANNPDYAEPLAQMRQRMGDYFRAGNFANESITKSGDYVTYPVREMPADPDAGLLYQDPLNKTVELPKAYNPPPLHNGVR